MADTSKDPKVPRISNPLGSIQASHPVLKRSVEQLSHFNCPHCSGWFSIGDAPPDRLKWFCPWCGKESTEG